MKLTNEFTADNFSGDCQAFCTFQCTGAGWGVVWTVSAQATCETSGSVVKFEGTWDVNGTTFFFEFQAQTNGEGLMGMCYNEAFTEVGDVFEAECEWAQ